MSDHKTSDQFESLTYCFQKEDALLLESTASRTEPLITPEKDMFGQDDPLLSILTTIQSMPLSDCVAQKTTSTKCFLDMIHSLYPADMLRCLEPPHSIEHDKEQIDVVLFDEEAVS